MALTKCSDCGRDLSSLAVSCPHCGRPMNVVEPLVPPEIKAIVQGKRVSCSDDNCTGIIGEAGYCGTCGKQYSLVDNEDELCNHFMDHEEQKLLCPKCSSSMISPHKKGFGLGKALLGLVITGPIGLLGGCIGANSITVTCLSCGYNWKVGALQQEKRRPNEVVCHKCGRRNTIYDIKCISCDTYL